MKTRVEYTEKALKDMEKLDRTVARNIIKKIQFYTEQPNPLSHARKLKPPFDDLYRYRINDYRAIFEYTTNKSLLLLTILKVEHRKDIY